MRSALVATVVALLLVGAQAVPAANPSKARAPLVDLGDRTIWAERVGDFRDMSDGNVEWTETCTELGSLTLSDGREIQGVREMSTSTSSNFPGGETIVEVTKRGKVRVVSEPHDLEGRRVVWKRAGSTIRSMRQGKRKTIKRRGWIVDTGGERVARISVRGVRRFVEQGPGGTPAGRYLEVAAISDEGREKVVDLATRARTIDVFDDAVLFHAVYGVVGQEREGYLVIDGEAQPERRYGAELLRGEFDGESGAPAPWPN